MIPKKRYIKPEINRIELDNSISLVMMSAPIDHHHHHSGVIRKTANLFASPFGDKPFG